MAPYVFTLNIPAERAYREIGPDVAGRFVEIIGGTSAEGAALSAALSHALDRVAPPSSGDVEIDFQSSPAGIEVTVRCAGRSSVVKHPFPAPQG